MHPHSFDWLAAVRAFAHIVAADCNIKSHYKSLLVISALHILSVGDSQRGGFSYALFNGFDAGFRRCCFIRLLCLHGRNNALLLRFLFFVVQLCLLPCFLFDASITEPLAWLHVPHHLAAFLAEFRYRHSGSSVFLASMPMLCSVTCAQRSASWSLRYSLYLSATGPVMQFWILTSVRRDKPA